MDKYSVNISYDKQYLINSFISIIVILYIRCKEISIYINHLFIYIIGQIKKKLNKKSISYRS